MYFFLWTAKIQLHPLPIVTTQRTINTQTPPDFSSPLSPFRFRIFEIPLSHFQKIKILTLFTARNWIFERQECRLTHRTALGTKRVSGLHFWARGYCVSTVGLDEETIRKYIREQEKNEKEQLDLEFDE